MAKRRAVGDGMIRKKAKGCWEIRIVIGKNDNGSPIFRYAYGKSQKDAIAKLHQLQETYSGVCLTEESTMSLASWLEKWLNVYMINSIKPSTFKSYSRIVDVYIKPTLGKKVISKITTDDCQKLYNHLLTNGRFDKRKKCESGLSPTSVRDVHKILHQAFNMAMAENIVPFNPTIGTTLPAIEKSEIQILDDEQLELFMQEIKKHHLWYDFFYTEITTGLRRGEICGLKWSDFDEYNERLSINRTVSVSNGTIIENDTKTTNSTRTFILPTSTFEILKRRKALSNSEWIFPSLTDKNLPTNPTRAYVKLKEILKSAGLPNIRFHDLRHTFATHALQSGVDVKTLSKILGHKSAAFTLDTYTHVTTDMQRNAANTIGDMMTDILGKELKPWQKDDN